MSRVRVEGHHHTVLRCFGVLEPGFYGAVDLNTGRSYLYQPKLDEEWRLWKGHIPSNQEVSW